MNLRARHTFAKRWKYRRADLQASSSTPTPDDERTKRRTFVSRTPDGFDAEEETIKIRSLFDLSIFPKVTKRKRERFFIATIVSTRRNRNSVTSFTYIYISIFNVARDPTKIPNQLTRGWSDRRGIELNRSRVRVGGRIHTDKVHRRRQAKRRSAETSSPSSIPATYSPGSGCRLGSVQLRVLISGYFMRPSPLPPRRQPGLPPPRPPFLRTELSTSPRALLHVDPPSRPPCTPPRPAKVHRTAPLTEQYGQEVYS